jgi:hypothetical protein
LQGDEVDRDHRLDLRRACMQFDRNGRDRDVDDEGIDPEHELRGDDDREPLVKALHRVRDTSGICSRCRAVICPSGGLLNRVSSPLYKNISLPPSGKSSLQIRAIPPHKSNCAEK